MRMSLDGRGKAHAPGRLSRTTSRATRSPRQRGSDLHTPPPSPNSTIMAKQHKMSPASAAVRMTTAEATVSALIAHGIQTIYALPGVHNDALFDALFKAADHIRVIHTRHEQGAAYMALGAALATGEPAAYAVVPGPGFLNSTAALATAYACNAPVLALIGQIPAAAIGRHLGLLHEIPDQLGIMRSL